MIPAQRLVFLALVPVCASLALVAAPGLWPVLLAVDLGIAIVAAVDALWGRSVGLEVVRTASKVFSVGRTNAVDLEVQSRSKRTVPVELVDDLFPHATSTDFPLSVVLPPLGQVKLGYKVRPTRRGSYELGDHHLRILSPLRLWKKRVRIPARQAVKIYPDVQAVRMYEAMAREQRENALVRAVRLRGGENEFERLRDYQKDDEFRAVDWKATARRQKLTAREYQLEQNQNIVCLIDCGRLMTAEVAGLSQLDHALNAMLMLGHVAARTGDHVGMLAFANEVLAFLPPTGGARASPKLIQASYDLQARLVESDYDAAFDALALRLRKRSLVIVFSQLIDEASATLLKKRLHAIKGRHLPLLVLFRDMDVEALVSPTTSPARPKDPTPYIQGAAAEILTWQHRLIGELRAGSVLVLQVDPRQLTPRLISRYLEIKSRQLL